MAWSSRINIVGFLDRLTEPPAGKTIKLFKSAIYGLILLNTLFLLPMADEIWGADSVINRVMYHDSLIYHLLYFLMLDDFYEWYGLIIALQVVAILIWFFGKFRLVVSVVIYLSTAALFNSAHTYVTGGHTLLKLFLFYFIFIGDKPGTPVRNAVSNLFLLACKIQLALLYFFAALYKWTGTHWVNGEALYFVLSIREFSHPFLQEWLLPANWLLKTGTWIGLGYQTLFPFLVWFRKTKKPLLILGIGFHLFIAFGTGLPDFGLCMVASYAVFVNNQTAENWLSQLRGLFIFLPSRMKKRVG